MNKHELGVLHSVIEDLETAQNGVYLSVAKDNMMRSARDRLKALVEADQRGRADQAADQARDIQMEMAYEDRTDLGDYDHDEFTSFRNSEVRLRGD